MSVNAAQNPKRRAQGGKKPPWARLLIATLLGYVATVLISSALTSLLPIHRSEATMMSLLLAGLVYTMLFIYVFAVKTWVRALRDIVGMSLAAGAMLLVTKGVIF